MHTVVSECMDRHAVHPACLPSRLEPSAETLLVLLGISLYAYLLTPRLEQLKANRNYLRKVSPTTRISRETSLGVLDFASKPN